MLTLIIGRAKTGKTTCLLEQVKECPAMGMAQRIVIVPEQLSHTTERRLSALCGDHISFVSEVLSFTRLYNRVCSISGGGARKTLDSTGRILTARLALSGIRHRLKVFASASGRGEFLESMVSIIDELKSYEVTPQMLADTAKETTGLFSEKLSELGLILGAYDAAMAQGTYDPRDHMTLLVGQLQQGGYAKGRHFFVDGFMDFSTQEMSVLRQILLDGESLTIAVPCDDLYGNDGLFAPGRETAVRLCEMAKSCGHEIRILTPEHRREIAPSLTYMEKYLFSHVGAPYPRMAREIAVGSFGDLLSECRRCGAILKKHAMNGIRYRDMFVCTGNEESYGALLETVFSSMGIPLYRTKKRAILSHPAAAFVLLAIESAADNLETETVTAYLKTGYSGVDRDICDAIENYAITWKIRGSRWQGDWNMHPEGYDGALTPEIREELHALTAAKDQAIAPLIHLRTRIRNAQSAEHQMVALYEFLEETGLYETLEREIQTDVEKGLQERAQETAQIYSYLLECFQQIYSVLGKTAPKTDELLQIMKLALGQYQVGTIPAVLDAVQFGAIDQVRGQEPKLLYVLGANAGVLPSVPAGGSLLSERERCILRDEFHMTLAPDSEKNMERQLLTIYSAFTAATEHVYLSHCTQNGAEQLQPSFLVERLVKLFPERGALTEEETEFTVQSAAETLLMYEGDMEHSALAAAISRAAKEITTLAQAIVQGRGAAQPRQEQVTEENARALFHSPVPLTASRLDQLGKCPLNFFLNYGLKAKKRKEATFDAAEFGTFIHFVLEKTVESLSKQGNITALDFAESEKMVEAQLSAYAQQRNRQEVSTSREDYLYQRNGQEAALVLQEVSQELEQSDFKPREFELNFGGKDGLPPVRVSGTLGEGTLSGYVDRADVWEGPEGDYLRVVDYKSGTKKFDYTELYSGLGMQMLLYLFAMESGSREKTIPSGVLYMSAKRPFASGDAEDEGESKGSKRSGLVLDEEAVLSAMEHGEKFQYLPVKNAKSGHGDYAISRKQMDMLKVFVEEKMAGAVDTILSGEFEAKPFYRGRSSDPCSYCDYLEVCQRDKQFRRQHYHEDISPKEFWEKLGGAEHG